MTGSTIPGFELGELLGRGGCASVYRARQVSVDRDVALKIDNRHVATERDRRRFLREVTAVGRLSGHPHVVEIYDAGVLADDRPWIAMQLCPNGSLHDHVRDHGPLTFAELQRVGVQLADALATSHAAGIVHRDVKPGNVLVNTYGVVVLSDFGLASVLDADSRQSATRGVFTPAYAAPEALGLDDPTPAMDLWSFACTVFELVTGRLPRFRGRGEPIGPDDVVAAALAEPFEPVALPPDLVRWLVRGLAFDPADRWPSAAHMRDELDALDLTVVPDLADLRERGAARPPLLLERLASTPAPPASGEPTQAAPEAVPPGPSSPSAAPPPARVFAPSPDVSPPPVVRRERASGPRSVTTRPAWLAVLAAAAMALAVGATWVVAGRVGPRAAADVAPSPSAASPAAGAGESSSAGGAAPAATRVVPPGDPGTWVLDADQVGAALDRVQAAAGHPLRFTNIMAVRVPSYTRIVVDVQDPADRESVQEYTVDGAGVVTGPNQVTSLSLKDFDAPKITAAMVDKRTFTRDVLPDRAAFVKGQQAALDRVDIRKGEVTYWMVNAYGVDRPRILLGVESAYGKAYVYVDRAGGVVQVLA